MMFVRCDQFVRPCRSFPFPEDEVTSDGGEGSEMGMARSCGADFGWARSALVVLAKQPPQCPLRRRPRLVLYLHTSISPIDHPILCPQSIGHRT